MDLKLNKMKNYTGSDLGQDFKTFFTKETKHITIILKSIGCTDIQMSRQFYYYYGFFTSPTGQPYYFSCSDVRFWKYEKILFRTVKNYNDYTGGHNQYIETNNLKQIKLS